MNKRMVFSLVAVLSLVSAPLVFGEESSAVVPEVAADQAVPNVESVQMPGSDVSWVWGEVKSVDAASAIFTISYMDYQTDQEKEMALVGDAETKFDNIASLAEIKIGDTVSVDYAVKDGKSIAKNVSVEKMEELPEAPKGDVPAGIEEPAPVVPEAIEPAAPVETSASEVKAE